MPKTGLLGQMLSACTPAAQVHKHFYQYATKVRHCFQDATGVWVSK